VAAYPTITAVSFGSITIDGEVYEHDVWIRADTSVKKRKKKLAKEAFGTSHKIAPPELEKVCKGDPKVLFIGAGESGLVELTDDGRAFLGRRGVEVILQPTPQIIESYNACERRKAALIHVTC